MHACPMTDNVQLVSVDVSFELIHSKALHNPLRRVRRRANTVRELGEGKGREGNGRRGSERYVTFTSRAT